MRIIDFFERTYIINLPQRTDRRRAMLKELEGVEISLVPKKVEIFPAICPTDAGAFPSIGARGCFLSHLNVLKRVKEDCLANVLVMEDDLSISKNFMADEANLVNQLSASNWGFVYFGHVEKTLPAPKATLQPFSGNLLTTHFYGVNATILDRLLVFLEELQRRPAGHPDGGPMHIDGAYSTFREQNPDVTTLIASPNLGFQRSSRSDISPNWLDRFIISKQLVDLARAGKMWLGAK
jgi:hypothetical protein